MRRVVVTGLGVVSPLGSGVKANWEALSNGRSGIRTIAKFDSTTIPVHIDGEIPEGTEPGQLDLNRVASPKEQRHFDRVTLLGLAAADQAMADCGYKPETEKEKARFGVVFGSGQGGAESFRTGCHTALAHGAMKISPFFIPSILINQTSGMISIRYGLGGPNQACSTACATGNHAIGDAMRLIKEGYADMMLAGSSEAALLLECLAGFAQLRALSTHNDEPEKASRPWDKARDGFVMSEGAGALILEEYEHAKARGAKIYGEVVGYGLSGDAHHITAPGGTGAERAIRMALDRAQMNPEEIDYINAHGTSTPAGDLTEFLAVKQVFGQGNTAMSSTKSMTGHMLGAAGSVEAVYSLLALQNNVMPPTLNLDNPEEETKGFNLVPHTAQEKNLRTVLSNSFGFGGTNACLIFKKV
ncbi:MAG: beta-ketoacyl-ACP synthase II [Alphaproteobacteria bacterium]|nr:beta-ketoacyl-ACP synthase II [Alphaproteobacteria bacterium]